MKDVYVITGATGGMGSDIAKKITKKGTVVLADIDAKKLTKLKTELTKSKIKAKTIVCDISRKDDIDQLVGLVKDLGNFKVMVHTAGVSESMKNANNILKINLVGTKLLMDAFYEIANDSIFINIASMTGHMVPDSFLYNKLLTNPTQKGFLRKMSIFTSNKPTNAYAFSKKGMILLTEKEVGKWAKKNSRILSISPGAIKTPLSLLEAKSNPAVDFMVSNTPIPRFGEVEEITDLVNFLISKKATFINGADILIDGGITSHIAYNDIFGLKKDKIPVITPFVLYIIAFLIFPLIFELFYRNWDLLAIKQSIQFFVSPAVVVLITGYLNKSKVSPLLIVLPFAVSLFSNLLVYQSPNWLLSVFYSVVALAVSWAISLYNKYKK